MTGFDLPAGDNAVLRRTQLAVTGLVAGEIELGARRASFPLSRTQRSRLLIETGATDQLIFRKAGKPRMVGARARKLCIRGSTLCLQRFDLQLKITWIQLGKQIPAADAIADVHHTSRQLSADPERQHGFFSGADFASVGAQALKRGAGGGVCPDHQYRPWRLRRVSIVAAGNQSDHRQ